MKSWKLPPWILLLVPLLLFSCERQEVRLDSNSPINFYAKSGTELRNECTPLKDGGFAFYGGADEDAYLMIVDVDGTERWFRTAGGEHYEDFGGVIETEDGGFIAVGTTRSRSKGAPENGLHDGYAVKFDANGNLIWEQNYGDLLPDAFYYGLALPNNQAMLIGSTRTLVDGRNDTYMVKIDANGNAIWEKSYGLSLQHHEGRSAVVGKNGQLIVTVNPAPKYEPYFYNRRCLGLLGLNLETGDSLWAVVFDDYLKEDEVSGSAYHQDIDIFMADDGYVTAQLFEEDDVRLSTQVIKVDFSGNMAWEKKFYGLGNMMFYAMKQANDGGFVLLGASTSEKAEPYVGISTGMSTVIKLDKDGNQQWASYTGSEAKYQFAMAANQLNDSWHIAGYTFKGQHVGQFTTYKIDNTGAIINK